MNSRRLLRRLLKQSLVAFPFCFTLYFGPWFPLSFQEARGFLRRIPSPFLLTSTTVLSPQLSTDYSITTNEEQVDDLLIVIPARNSENSLQLIIDQIKSEATRPDLIKIVIVYDSIQSKNSNNFHNFDFNGLKSGVCIYGNGNGRGSAQHLGAKLETAKFLLFCHADTLLPKNFDEIMKRTLNYDKTVLMTAFSFSLDKTDHFFLNFVTKSANLRSTFWWMPYGDQALGFRQEDYFQRFNGFREDLKIMEDFDLVRRVRSIALLSTKNERIEILKDKIVTSSRRWEEKGIFKTTFLNWCFCAAFVYLGISPDTIFKWYYKVE